MVQIQKVISAVGMFSIFEAKLQNVLNCRNGFRGVAETLTQQGDLDLQARFADLLLAIHVLKHGRGQSYDVLVNKAASLPFKVKLANEDFFNEGDVGEASTHVEVDDAFALGCADVIREVAVAFGKAGHRL